jgi:hypothetical protein
MMKQGKVTCEYPNCQEDSVSLCDICDVYFCEEHGNKRQKHSTVWSRGYVSLCWKCGWPNADEHE